MYPYAIRTQNLTRDFAALRAVDRLCLEIPAGIIFGFLGPNGAGKTTTIRLLLGLLDPTEGSADVLGFDVRSQGGEIRRRSGVLLEHSGLYERLSAEDNLEFYGRIWRLASGERRERIRALLSGLGLWERRGEVPATWSRGMKQKLGIARALLHRPALLFLDEPTAGLDPMSAAALREDLANLVEKEGVSVFLTTHNLTEAEKLCHRVGIIRQGKLLAVDSPENLRALAGGPRMEIAGKGFTAAILDRLRALPEVASVEQQDERLYVRLRQPADSAPIVSLLVAWGAQVEEVRKGLASLEEVFLTLMKEEQQQEEERT